MTNSTNVVLEKGITTLDTVRVFAGAADALVKSGFTRRRTSSFGKFIDRDAIAKRPVFDVQDLLRDLPGMMVMPYMPGGGPTLLM